MSGFGRRVFGEGEEIQETSRLWSLRSDTAHFHSRIFAVSVCRRKKIRMIRKKIGRYYLLVRIFGGQTVFRVRLCGWGQP